MTVRDMTGFMGEDGDEFLMIFGQLHEFIRDDDDSGRQSERVRANSFAGAKLKPQLMIAPPRTEQPVETV